MFQSILHSTYLRRYPAGLYVLSLTTMWELFALYGIRSLLVLYMVKVFSWEDARTYSIFGAVGGFTYILTLLGVWFEKNILGKRYAVYFGTVISAIGCFLLAVPNETFFYIALATMICGSGLARPNMVKLVDQLYVESDHHQDAGFTLYYVIINFGAFIAPITVGLLVTLSGFTLSFIVSGLGLIFSLATFFLGRKFLPHTDPPLNVPKSVFIFRVIGLILLLVFLIFSFQWIILHQLTGWILNAVSLGLLAWIMFEFIRSSAHDRKRILAMLALLFFGTLFWVFNMQSASSITLFTERIVDRNFLGWTIPTPFFQAINPLSIFIIGPLLAQVWLKSQKHEPGFESFNKFGWAMICIACCFFALALGSRQVLDIGSVSWLWVVLAYFFSSVGELLCEPIGLSASNHIPPHRLIGIMIAAWYIYTGSYASYLGAAISQLADIPAHLISSFNTLQISQIYGKVFNEIAWISVASALLLWGGMMWVRRAKRS